ncbi:MAG: chorismate mutase, partial [Myxococcota bacterium]
GLPIVRERIQDHAGNATRFLMVSTEDASPTGDDRTTIAFALSDDGEKGALRRALEDIEEAGVNMTRIESRPRPGASWRYVFLADLVGHRTEAPVASALDRLERRSEGVRVLGSYPRFVPSD